MNQLIMTKFIPFLHFIFLIFIIDVRAQVQQSPQDSNNFQPSLALVIGFLSIMFFLTFILLLYAKFCHRVASVRSSSLRIRDGLFRSRSSASGLDKAVVESLPFFRYSSLRGSRDGLECSVCLSKFEDVEILRLLPKCKHAFHIDCIDQWLEKHSTCPICRRKISPEDVTELPYSNSLRFLSSQSVELRDDSDFELYVQREENDLGSSRFSIGRSFRWYLSRRDTKEDELPIQRSHLDSDQFNKRFHRFNHRVVGCSDVVFKNRWSNVSSSDLVFLNSEFLNDASSARFISNKSMEVEEIQKENDQMTGTISQTGHSFLNFPGLPTTSDSTNNLESGSKFPYPFDKRSMSEIVVHPRITEFKDNTDSFLAENSESERIRRLWIPIARKTVQWFTNRESRPPNPQGQ
ncbi:E3 ubiquitin-protein ligase ATL42-like [Primulina huaijiensis]|uniref:E3 ubiquitin-protein ligase ATL42-like n=1 Tax=Primulina huaijiensis TaxID=1492673 RepID=UPI003CC707E6